MRPSIYGFQLAIVLLLANHLVAGQGGGGESTAPPNPVVHRHLHPRPRSSPASRGSNSTQLKPDLSDEIEETIENGNTARNARNYSLAEVKYQRALLLNSKESRAYYGLGNVYYDQRRFDEAMQQYKKAAQLNPDFVEAHIYLGYIYSEQKHYPEAIEEYQGAFHARPKVENTSDEQAQREATYLQAVAHNNLGSVYDDLHRNQESIDQYQQAIRLQPNFAEPYYNLGMAYFAQGRAAEAIEPFEQARRLKPALSTFKYLGVSYLGQHRNQDALQVLLEAVRRTPDDAEAVYGLGAAWWANGYSSPAMEQYRLLQRLNPGLAADLLKIIQR